ncbi:hypothetical protein N9E28_01445 [Alphaproteobacteria bacterium]|nr:hypothetical protein [Alphaproteobacteria bacterium]
MSNYLEFEMPIISVPNVSSLDRNSVIEQLDKTHFACIRGCFDPNKLLDCHAQISSKISQINFEASTGENADAVRTNFAKTNIGGASSRYNNYPRFFRTIYNPLWEEDIFGLRSEFKKLIQIRNIIYNLDMHFGSEGIEENGLFSACRLQHYPTGGGFFGTHRDTTLVDVANEKSFDFYQLILMISASGEHFEEGGAFIEKDGRRLLLEKKCLTGDVLIYDGRTLHGVEEIDPHKPLNLKGLSGRIVALASLYKS